LKWENRRPIGVALGIPKLSMCRKQLTLLYLPLTMKYELPVVMLSNKFPITFSNNERCIPFVYHAK
jgi:hypothetical protein